MNEGTRVARVSLRSDEGTIGERGTIRRTYRYGPDAGDQANQPAGYSVEWDKTDAKPARMGYVAPVRIVDLDTYLREEANRKAAA